MHPRIRTIFIFASFLSTSLFAQDERPAMLYRSGNCEKAVVPLKAAAAQNPALSIPLAICQIELQDTKTAIRTLTAYLDTHEADSEAAQWLALAYEKDGDGNRAASMLTDFLAKHAEVIALHTTLGDVYAHLAQPAKATVEYQSVLATAPDDPGARIGLANLSIGAKKFDEGIRSLEDVRKTVGDSPRLLAMIGSAYIDAGDCAKAVGPLRLSLEKDPGNYPISKKLAVCFNNLEQWEGVIEALRTGTAAEYADTEATRLVLGALRSLKRPAETEKYCRDALASAPKNLLARIELGHLLFRQTKFAAARTEYLAAIGENPDLPLVNDHLGQIAEREANNADAKRYYHAAVASKHLGGLEAADGMRLRLAELCVATQDLDCARNALDQVTPAVASTKEPLWLRARLEFASSNWKEAEGVLEQLLKAQPDEVKYLQMVAKCYDKLNDTPKAIETLERAVTLAPTDKNLRYDLVGIYSNTGAETQWTRAIDLLTEFLNKYEKDPEGYFLLGNLYRQKQDADSARHYFDLGVTTVVPPIPPKLSWAFNAYGTMLLKDAKYDQAYVVLLQATQLQPDDEGAQFNLALDCLKLGNKPEQLAAARAKLDSLHSKYLQQLDDAIESANAHKK